MKPKENLVTVCGHNTTMLHHMLRHYQHNVKEIFVVLYAHHKDDPVIEEGKQILDNSEAILINLLHKSPTLFLAL